MFGWYVGFAFPVKINETLDANLPKGISVASTTYHLRVMSCGLITVVCLCLIIFSFFIVTVPGLLSAG